jgi:hypothetical protein
MPEHTIHDPAGAFTCEDAVIDPPCAAAVPSSSQTGRDAIHLDLPVDVQGVLYLIIHLLDL